VAELALDDDQRHALARHLDGVGVPQLVGREAPSDAGLGGGVAQVGSRGGCRLLPAACGSVEHAQQRPDG
jgi:hypothetical protein